MQFRWFALFAALLFWSSPAAAQGNDAKILDGKTLDAKTLDAKTFVENIYKQYLGKDAPSAEISTLAGLERYFTPSLAQLVDQDSTEAEKRQDAPLLGGDPFVDAQDWEITDPVVTVQAGSDGKGATATAVFKNFGKPVTVRYVLVMTPKGWRIDNVIWTAGNLRGLYQPAK